MEIWGGIIDEFEGGDNEPRTEQGDMVESPEVVVDQGVDDKENSSEKSCEEKDEDHHQKKGNNEPASLQEKKD